jgi:hypothetical protein
LDKSTGGINGGVPTGVVTVVVDVLKGVNIVFITGSAAFACEWGAALQPGNTNNIAKISNGINLMNLIFNIYLLIVYFR